jgi:hypothetical protein
MFSTGQYGRLYLVSGCHARGKTFRLYVLPEGEAALSNGPSNGPLNADAVEVYGVTGGHPGWTETYGWLHHGKWEQDFAALVKMRRAHLAAAVELRDKENAYAAEAERQRKASLLGGY